MVSIHLTCRRLFRVSRLLSLTLLPAAVLFADDAAWAQAAGPSAGAEWTTPAGTVEGTRFSSLSQINARNVGRITQEFQFSTGVLAGHQGQPLVVGATMYVVGPFPNQLFALDLTSPGKTRWVFSPRPDEFAKGQACCDIVNRGAVFANGKVIYNALDNTTVAVDAVSGRQVWRTKLGDPRTGQTMTMAPLAVGEHDMSDVHSTEPPTSEGPALSAPCPHNQQRSKERDWRWLRSETFSSKAPMKLNKREVPQL